MAETVKQRKNLYTQMEERYQELETFSGDPRVEISYIEEGPLTTITVWRRYIH